MLRETAKRKQTNEQKKKNKSYISVSTCLTKEEDWTSMGCWKGPMGGVGGLDRYLPGMLSSLVTEMCLKLFLLPLLHLCSHTCGFRLTRDFLPVKPALPAHGFSSAVSSRPLADTWRGGCCSFGEPTDFGSLSVSLGFERSAPAVRSCQEQFRIFTTPWGRRLSSAHLCCQSRRANSFNNWGAARLYASIEPFRVKADDVPGLSPSSFLPPFSSRLLWENKTVYLQ